MFCSCKLERLGSGCTACAAVNMWSEIAGELSLSVKTVSTYRTRILEKLNLRTTADIISYCIQNDLSM